jgi:hypothetical protein
MRERPFDAPKDDVIELIATNPEGDLACDFTIANGMARNGLRDGLAAGLLSVRPIEAGVEATFAVSAWQSSALCHAGVPVLFVPLPPRRARRRRRHPSRHGASGRPGTDPQHLRTPMTKTAGVRARHWRRLRLLSMED